MLNDEIVKTIKQYKSRYDELVPKTSSLPFSNFYFMIRNLILKRHYSTTLYIRDRIG